MTRPAGANPTALARIKTELAEAARSLERAAPVTLARAVWRALKRPRAAAHAPPDLARASSPRGPAPVRRVPTPRARSRDGPPCAGPPKALNRQPCHVMARSVPERLNAHRRGLGTSPSQVRFKPVDSIQGTSLPKRGPRGLGGHRRASPAGVARDQVLGGRDSCGRNKPGFPVYGRRALTARSKRLGYSRQC